VLLHLEGRFRRLFKAATQNGSNRLEVLPDATRSTLQLLNASAPLPKVLREWFDLAGFCGGFLKKEK